MTKLKLLGATALVLSSIAAIPGAQAKQDINHVKRHSEATVHANRSMKMSKVDARRGQNQRRQVSYNNGYNNGSDRLDTGFWPADAAANVVGGAVDTAGAIATAPFRGDTYARNDNSYNNGWNNNGRNNGYYDSNAAFYGNRSDNNGWDRRDTGFWPADAAANVVGGAVDTAGAIAVGATNTAGAIATAPFRDNNGYNNGWNNNYDSNAAVYGNRGYNRVGYDNSYAARNGFVCQPGTWFKGEDGRQHPCQ